MEKILTNEIYSILNQTNEENNTVSDLERLFELKSNTCTILGFDIYKYSKYASLPQSLVPYMFRRLYNVAVKNCLEYETFIFQDYKKGSDFLDMFIDTGDGGFQIFNNPIEAIVFAVFFQANLKQYNSFQTKTKAREIIGEITLRYALTTDVIFKFENKYYGPGIINNARIMSKDKLNRFLIDSHSINWFDKNTNGIENIQTLNLEDFNLINYFSKYNKDFSEFKSLLFPSKKGNRSILKTDILKIDDIEAKGDIFSVYGIHIQVSIKTDVKNLNKYTVTLGNLNVTGLEK